ncbi:MAG TPA: hypothetical protein VLA90_07210 [Actinomycetota bacterium]|nr:hypothetical protein [Actinomycetota bacterium]
MGVPFDLPPELTLERDVSAADWLTARLLPLAGGGAPVLVGNLLPDGFEVYARLSFPGANVAPWEPPIAGQATALVGSLSRWTSAADRCCLCLWVGYGFISGARMELVNMAPGLRGWLRRRAKTRHVRRRAAAASAQVRRLPRVLLHPHGSGALREYLMFTGPISAVETAFLRGWHQLPNLWWPDDRAWVVATEIYASSTYVAGSRGLLEDLLTSPDLRAEAADPGEPLGRQRG